MNNTQRLLSASRVFYREFSKNAVNNQVASPRYSKMQQVQKQLGLGGDIPVYIKGGYGDKALYSLTVLLTLGGLGCCLDVFYRLTVGQKE